MGILNYTTDAESKTGYEATHRKTICFSPTLLGLNSIFHQLIPFNVSLRKMIGMEYNRKS